MHKKTIGILAGLMVLGLTLVGCNQGNDGGSTTTSQTTTTTQQESNENAEKLAKEATRELAEANYIEARLEDFQLDGSLGPVNVNYEMNGTMKLDKSGQAPKASLNGKIKKNNEGEKDFKFYVDENDMITVMGDDRQQEAVSDEVKQDLMEIKGNASKIENINTTVTLQEEGNKKQLRIVPDNNQMEEFVKYQILNVILSSNLLETADVQVREFEMTYILNQNDKLEEIRYDLTVGMGENSSAGATLTGNIKINKMGSDRVEVTRP